MENKTPVKNLESHRSLRYRLALATLTGTTLRISNIRAQGTSVGVNDDEVSFLRLLDAITNGSQIEVSMTGTTILYRPGVITGSSSKLKTYTHIINPKCTRGITYYLEPLLLLAPFSKRPISVLFKGSCITAATKLDYSVDTFRAGVLPLFASLFNLDDPRPEVRIIKRSCSPLGSGEVHFTFHERLRVAPKTLHLRHSGRLQSIKGVAYCIGVPSGNSNQMISAARSLLNGLVSDIHIFADVSGTEVSKDGKMTSNRGGVGYGLSLIAETTNMRLFSSDAFAVPGESPEDVGHRAARMLLAEVEVGGAIERKSIPLVAAMMNLATEGDIGTMSIGVRAIDDSFVSMSRDLRSFFGREMALKTLEEEEFATLTVAGSGIGNIAKEVH